MTSLSNAPSGSRLRLDFSYDYQGRRIQKLVSAWNDSTYVPQATNLFVYAGWNLMTVLGCQASVLQSFLWGLDLSGSIDGAGGVGGLLAVSDTISGSHFTAFDGNGNVAKLVNASDGTLSAFYEYGPFGEVVCSSGSFAKTNPLRFSTKYQDNETDLLYYGYRYYSASTGRWESRDPLQEEGGANLYAFVNNNAIGRLDIDGDIGLDTALDLLVLGVDLSTGGGAATIAPDIAALAISAQPTPVPIVNPRAVQTITRLINGQKKTYELVDRALLRAVADEPTFKGIVWNDLASRPQRANVVLEYQGRMPNQLGNIYDRHFKSFSLTDEEAARKSLNGPGQFAPGIDDGVVRVMIDEALQKHRAEFSQTFLNQLDNYVYDAAIPFGRPGTFRTTIGYSKGKCTTRIRLHVGRDGTVHAFAVLDRPTVGGSIVTPVAED